MRVSRMSRATASAAPTSRPSTTPRPMFSNLFGDVGEPGAVAGPVTNRCTDAPLAVVLYPSTDLARPAAAELAILAASSAFLSVACTWMIDLPVGTLELSLPFNAESLYCCGGMSRSVRTYFTTSAELTICANVDTWVSM